MQLFPQIFCIHIHGNPFGGPTVYKSSYFTALCFQCLVFFVHPKDRLHVAHFLEPRGAGASSTSFVSISLEKDLENAVYLEHDSGKFHQRGRQVLEEGDERQESKARW